jgi:hypothetical protein
VLKGDARSLLNAVAVSRGTIFGFRIVALGHSGQTLRHERKKWYPFDDRPSEKAKDLIPPPHYLLTRTGPAFNRAANRSGNSRVVFEAENK